MRPLFHSHLVNGSRGDPVLYVDCLFERRALLFDLGDIHALPPRKLMRTSHVFVSHAHMDHFMGFDWMLRILLGRERALHLFGPRGFLQQVEHKLNAYTWNLVHNYTADFTLHVTELLNRHQAIRASFHCMHAFHRENEQALELHEGTILDEPAMTVRFDVLDHGGTPCIAYALQESAHINIWKNRLAEMGLPVGAWLRELKQAVLRGEPDDFILRVHWREHESAKERVVSLRELTPALRVVPGQKLAFVTDVSWQPGNVARIGELAERADMLYIEAAFMQRDAGHAKAKHHLTAAQAGLIARDARVGMVVPMHISPRYQGNDMEQLYQEILTAYGK